MASLMFGYTLPSGNVSVEWPAAVARKLGLIGRSRFSDGLLAEPGLSNSATDGVVAVKQDHDRLFDALFDSLIVSHEDLAQAIFQKRLLILHIQIGIASAASRDAHQAMLFA